MSSIVNALEGSSDRIKALFNSIPNPIYAWQLIDKNLKLIDYNNAAEKTSGKQIGNKIGKNASEFYKNRPDIVDDLYKCMREKIGISREMEYTYEPSGDIKFLTVKYEYLPPDLVLVHTEDITEYKEVEQELTNLNKELEEKIEKRTLKLKESEERWHSLFFNAPDNIYVIERNGTILDLNRSSVDKPIEQVIGTKVFDYLTLEIQEVAKKHLDLVFETGKNYQFLSYILSPDGKKIWFDNKISPLKEGNKVVSALYFYSDITERKLAEEKSEESEKRYKNLSNEFEMILDHIPALVFYKDTQNRFLRVNKFVVDAYNLSKEDLVGKSLFDLYPEEAAQAYWDDDLEVINSGRSKLNFEEPWDTVEGKKWISTSKIPFIDEEGNIIGIIGVSRDITERKKAEQKLKESENRLQSILSSVTDQVTIVDRELNIIYANDSAIDKCGPSIIGRKCYECYYKKREICEDCQTIKIFEDGDIRQKELVREGINGKKYYYWTISSVVERDETGRPSLVVEVSRDTTKRREIELNLKKSQERYRDLFESCMDGIVITDMEGTIFEANKAYLEMIGYTLEEARRLFYQDITPEKWHKMEEDIVKSQFMTRGYSDLYEKENIRKDGSVVPIKLKGWILKDEQGDPIGMWGFICDITDLKKKEKMITDLARFPEQNPYPVLRVNREKILYSNQTGQEILKIGIGEKVPEFLQNTLNIAFNENVLKNVEVEINNRFYSFNISPIKTENYANIYGIDITTIKKTEQKLKESERRFREERDNLINMLNSMKDGVYIINSQYEIQFVNPSLKEMFGPVKNKKCYEYFQNQTEPCPLCKSLDPLQEESIKWEIKSSVNKKHYEIVATPLKRVDGTISKLVIFHNITALKDVERKLIKLNTLKSELLRRTSHELKTPLISIKGFSDLLLEFYRDDLDYNILDSLIGIKQGCTRLKTLIDDILKTSELKSGSTILKRSEEDLSLLIKLCVDELKGYLKLRGHTINLNIHENLLAYFEKESIHQVISNILINAIKYTPLNGIIEISSKKKFDFIIISIKDNGIGITEEEKDRLFQHFGKIERFGQGFDVVSEGSGLGLFISKMITEKHGGEIWVESEGRNKGAIFYFSLPIIKR